MALANAKPIRTAIIGMDERMRNTLQFFFKKSCNNLCVFSEEDSAEICIIDLDGYRGIQLGDEYLKRNPDQPAILLSLGEVENKNGIVLRKPLNKQDLLSALAQAQKKLQLNTAQATPVEEPTKSITSASVPEPPPSTRPSAHDAALLLTQQNTKAMIGTAPDIDPADANQTAKAQYDPGNYFYSYIQGALKSADARNRGLLIETTRGSITFFPESGQVASTISFLHLRTLSSMPIDEKILKISFPNNNSLPPAEDMEQVISRESLLWQISLCMSRGRVPKGTDLTAPVFLCRWPNMTRLLIFPHAMRIAALWIHKEHSLVDTSVVLGIPQRYVFAFYSAAHAVGLAGVSRRNADTLFEPLPAQKNTKRSLFGKILSSLPR